VAFPTITVELALTTNPTATPTWTDVSAYVRAIPGIESATRKDELGRRWEAGHCTVVFDNTDGRFDPGNPAGAYYPNLLPLRRIRIKANHNAVDYDLFSGYVDTWTPEWVLPEESHVAIRCSDASLVWANTSMPGSVHEVEVRDADPDAWWRLGDAGTSTTGVDASGNGHHLAYEGTVAAAAGLIYGDSDGGATFSATSRGTIPTGHQVLTDFGFTVCAWIQVDDAVPWHATIYAQQADANPGGAYNIVYFGYQAIAGEAFLQASAVVNDNINSFSRVSDVALTPGEAHHVACVFPAVGAALPAGLLIYIDGVSITGTGSAISYANMPAFPTSMIYSAIGNAPDGAPSAGNVDGILDEVQIYKRVLSAGEIAALATAGSEPWGSELSGARVTHALDACAWPAADRDIDAGTSTLRKTDLTGSLLSYLQSIADSENGAVYATRDGKARFRARHTLLTTARHNTSQATFSDAPAGAELDYVDVAVEQREQLIRNRVRFKRTGGSVVQVDDQTSQDKFFVRAHPSGTGAVELQIESDTEVADAATWYLAAFKDPHEAVTGLELEPYGDDVAKYAQMLGRQLEDRVTVEYTPVGSAQRSQETLIVGIRHEIPDVEHWRTTFRLSPADTTAYLVLDNAVLGQLDANAIAY
jgi:hypothetical protein